ncbi:MAG: ATP-binding cassette domain-containing protein [Mycobacteriales bacterium]
MDRPPTAVHSVAKQRVSIGRSTDNDIVLQDLLVSRRHAELLLTAGGWEIVDLDSDNGTHVNGRRVPRAAVGTDDVVGIGHQLFRLVDGRLEEYVDTGQISFQASDLVVTVNGRRLLDDVSFALEGRALLGIVGPSGAGKSTLLNALTGFRPADHGSVGYAGRDLYSNFDDLRHRMGLVPQQDVLHPQLTVRRALQYAAELRFPQDVSAGERARRIEEVLGELGLTPHAEQRISTLSGGQRKRTSIALELLTKPSLLFLDEPTSGLDPGLDRSVMHTLRQLADDGRTVVVVTHNVANLAICDRVLVLAPGGRVAYFGPPADAIAYFGVEDFADVFIRLEQAPRDDWAARFRLSPMHERYLRSRLIPVVTGQSDASAAEAIPRQQTAVSQFLTLCRRYVRVIAADRQYAMFLAALPLALSLLAHAVPAGGGLSLMRSIAPGGGEQRPQLLLVLVLGGCLMGTAASLRELVKEREIYRRERAIGLSLTAYLASKLVILSVITGLQGVVLALLGMAGGPGPDAPALLPSGGAEIVAAVVLVAVASMTIGLLISVVADNADRTMPLLVLVVMAQLVLSGGFVPVAGRPVLSQLSWVAPARWSFAATASTSELKVLPGTTAVDHSWRHAASVWTTNMAALVVLSAAFILLVAILLRRIEPRRGRARTSRRSRAYAGAQQELASATIPAYER